MKRTSLATDELNDIAEHIRSLLTRIENLEQQHKKRRISVRRYRHLMKLSLPKT